MSRPSTQLRFADVYPSFREASHVSPLVQQESGPGHPTIDISGRRCLESFEKLAPPTSWRRTFVVSLVGMKGWFSTRCALTWKVKATKSSRSYFLLQASTRRTAETASGLLLTPTTREEPVDLDKFKARMEKYDNGTTVPNLATQVIGMLPTPRASESIERRNWKTVKDKVENKGDVTLTTLARYQKETKKIMLPTPTRFDYNSARTPEKWEEDKAKYAKKGINLQNPLKQHARLGMLPTPLANDHKGGVQRKDPKRQRDTLAHAMHNSKTGKTSQLSPLFVEEMMGFPKGWTISPFQNGEEKA